jgi:hypothetical protein
MAAAVSDAIIIGSVLMMVFGALFYYLYSRVLHNEKRMSVMENILLDIKMATDTVFSMPPDHIHSEPLQEINEYVPVAATATATATATVTPTVDEAPTQEPVEQKTVVSINYESMNIKELQQEARNRSIPGVSGLRRKELIEQLRKSDGNTTTTETTVQGGSVSLDTFVESAAEVPQ